MIERLKKVDNLSGLPTAETVLPRPDKINQKIKQSKEEPENHNTQQNPSGRSCIKSDLIKYQPLKTMRDMT